MKLFTELMLRFKDR